MGTFFVPYHDNTPAAIEINGHRVLIIASELADLSAELSAVGGTEIRELQVGSDESEQLADLAHLVEGGVVLAPPGISVTQMIDSLKIELPWVH